MIQKAKIILFDLGGVLMKSVNPKKLYNAINANIDFLEFKDYWNYDKTVYDAHQGLISDKEHIEKLLQFSNSNKTVEEFFKIYEELDLEIYKENYELVKNVKRNGYLIGILSNLREMDYNRVNKIINPQIFDYKFLSYKMKELKPNKNIYNKVINECNVNPSEIYFFDDNIENVQGALNSGIHAVHSIGSELGKHLKENGIILEFRRV